MTCGSRFALPAPAPGGSAGVGEGFGDAGLVLPSTPSLEQAVGLGCERSKAQCHCTCQQAKVMAATRQDNDDARTSGGSGRLCNGLVPAGRAPVASETQFGPGVRRKGAFQRDGQDAVGMGRWSGHGDRGGLPKGVDAPHIGLEREALLVVPKCLTAEPMAQIGVVSKREMAAEGARTFSCWTTSGMSLTGVATTACHRRRLPRSPSKSDGSTNIPVFFEERLDGARAHR